MTTTLHQAQAWNWVWPDEKNRWATGGAKPKGVTQPYSGPSKRTRAKRAAKRARARR